MCSWAKSSGSTKLRFGCWLKYGRPAFVPPLKLLSRGLQRLIQIAGFVVPEPISTCAHVACLSHPVRSELVLHGQIPFQYPRNQTLRPGGLDGAVDVDWI